MLLCLLGGFGGRGLGGGSGCGGGLFFVGFDYSGDAEEFVAFGEGEEFDAFTAAVDFADGVHRAADTLAFGGEEHDFVGVFDAQGTGDVDRAVFR